MSGEELTSINPDTVAPLKRRMLEIPEGEPYTLTMSPESVRRVTFIGSGPLIASLNEAAQADRIILPDEPRHKV